MTAWVKSAVLIVRQSLRSTPTNRRSVSPSACRKGANRRHRAFGLRRIGHTSLRSCSITSLTTGAPCIANASTSCLILTRTCALGSAQQKYAQGLPSAHDRVSVGEKWHQAGFRPWAASASRLRCPATPHRAECRPSTNSRPPSAYAMQIATPLIAPPTTLPACALHRSTSRPVVAVR
jgi:hypothetical protein